MHHRHIFLSRSECEAPFCFRGLISQPSGYSPNTASLLILSKNGKTAVFCTGSLSYWTLSVAGGVFYSETAPPCRLCDGSPVCCVGALPPGHNTARRKGTGGFCTLYCSSAISSLYHLTSFKILSEDYGDLPAWAAETFTLSSFPTPDFMLLSHPYLFPLYVYTNPACRDHKGRSKRDKPH